MCTYSLITVECSGVESYQLVRSMHSSYCGWRTGVDPTRLSFSRPVSNLSNLSILANKACWWYCVLCQSHWSQRTVCSLSVVVLPRTLHWDSRDLSECHRWAYSSHARPQQCISYHRPLHVAVGAWKVTWHDITQAWYRSYLSVRTFHIKWYLIRSTTDSATPSQKALFSWTSLIYHPRWRYVLGIPTQFREHSCHSH